MEFGFEPEHLETASPPFKMYVVYDIQSSLINIFVLHENHTMRRIGFHIKPDGTYGPKTVWWGKVEEERDFRMLVKEVLDGIKETVGPHNVMSYSVAAPSQEVLSQVMGEICDAAESYSILRGGTTGWSLDEENEQEEGLEEDEEEEEDGGDFQSV